jgi:Uma2 family endonuclease
VAQPTHPYRQPMYPWPAPQGTFTPDDLLDMPSDGHRYEIIEGALHVAPPAGIGHHGIADAIARTLFTAAPEGWRPIREIGIQLGDSLLIPDVTVLRPGADLAATWAAPDAVALVVEVESKGSRKHDRFTKPALYAESGIESYWRIEPTEAGPVAHLYEGPSGGHFRHHRSINPGETHLAELPYPVQVAPATWMS